MSMVRLVTRIVPRDAPQDDVSRLLTPDQVDVPVRTTRTTSPSSLLSTETTFCRAVVVPPDCRDTDAAASAKCEGIAGLACLKKSRLRLVTEENGGDPAVRVVPEVNGEGQCTGMLLSIPLRIPRSEVGQLEWPAENGQTILSATSANDGSSFAFGGSQLNQNFPATLSATGSGDGSSFTIGGEQLNRNLQRALSIATDEHIQTTHSFLFNGMQLEPNRNPPTTLSATGTEKGSSFDFGRVQNWHNDASRNAQTTLSGSEDGSGFGGGTHLNLNLPHISAPNNEHATTTHSTSFNFSGTHQEPYQNLQTDVPNGDWNRADWNASCHEKSKHTCDQCGERFPGKKKLILHVKRVHEGVRCPFCDSRFESGKGLKGHMSSEHARELPHVCEVCSARFRTAETLKNHITQHRRRFRCDECGKGFTQKGLLQSHRNSVHS